MFKDNYKWMFCNSQDSNSFAIEPEVSYSFYENKGFSYDDYTRESENIYELINLHDENEEVRMEVYNEIQKFYKKTFPIWEDWAVSWWTHFVLFWDFSSFKENYKELKYKILNCPLHLKIDNLTLYGREMWTRCPFDYRKTIPTWSKGDYVCLKNSFLSGGWEVEWVPIEFRCNNVFDDRMLGYYQGVLLAVKNGIKFKKISDDMRNYAKEWDKNYYEDSDISLEDLRWEKISDDDMVVMRHNINKILTLLKEEGLINSARMLREYLVENGFKYIISLS